MNLLFSGVQWDVQCLSGRIILNPRYLVCVCMCVYYKISRLSVFLAWLFLCSTTSYKGVHVHWSAEELNFGLNNAFSKN